MNNEEKILDMLERLTGKIDKQGEQLAQQGEQLAKQGEQLAQQGEQLAQQGEQLTQMKEKLEELDERSQRTAVLLEVEVDRKLNLLYEGHDTIMESLDQLVPSSRVERLESDVSLLKHAVKLLRQEVSELKKAR